MNLTYTARASHAPNRVVRPRSLSTRALGRAHVHAKAARTDVGRSPRAIDSHARVGVPRSLARTYLEARGDAAGLLAVRCRSPCAPSVPLVSSYLSLSLSLVLLALPQLPRGSLALARCRSSHSYTREHCACSTLSAAHTRDAPWRSPALSLAETPRVAILSLSLFEDTGRIVSARLYEQFYRKSDTSRPKNGNIWFFDSTLTGPSFFRILEHTNWKYQGCLVKTLCQQKVTDQLLKNK